MENDGANRTITEQTVDTPSIEVEDQTPITDLKNNYRPEKQLPTGKAITDSAPNLTRYKKPLNIDC